MFKVIYIDEDDFSEGCWPWRCRTKPKKSTPNQRYPPRGGTDTLLPGALPKPISQSRYKRKKLKPKHGTLGSSSSMSSLDEGCSPCSAACRPAFNCFGRCLPCRRKKSKGPSYVSTSFKYRKPLENGWRRPQLYDRPPDTNNIIYMYPATKEADPNVTEWTLKRALRPHMKSMPRFLAPKPPPKPQPKVVYLSEYFKPPPPRLNRVEIDIYGESEAEIRRRAEARNRFLMRQVPGSRSFFEPFQYKFRLPTFGGHVRTKRKTRAFLISAVVTQPSGRKAYPKIEDNKDGTVTIRYNPTETGLHELAINYNNQPIQGSPFKFHVDAIDSGFVTAYGPGLSHGISGQPAHFTIVTKDAGAGGLSLAVEGPSKAEIQCVDNKDGSCSVSYVPTVPGEYNIIIKFADKHISGSPFTAKVTSPTGEQKRAMLSVGSSSEVSLKVTETDIGNLTATIRSPSGMEEPCVLKRLANGHLGISFTPREIGEHLVNVYRHGQHIPNSPFKIYVGESEIGNASKVKVTGRGIVEGMANQLNEFTINTKEAGYGGLSLSIEGPSKADIECHDNEDGSCRVTYKPTEPGNYIVNVKFADEHVPGSPFLVKVGGEPSGRVTERITRQREAADVTHIGSQCELSLKIPGTSPYDMEASVMAPSGVTEMCEILDLQDGHYSIKFVPKEMGIHTVSVKHKGIHIPGSPFQFTVGPITDGGAHKVRALGPGLERAVVNTPADFNIYTREAGAGGLSIAIEGPSKAEIDFQDRKDGSCGVTYYCSEPGEYLASVKFNDMHIPDSPFKVYVSPSSVDAQKLTIQSLQEQGLQINKPASFTVDFNGAQGKLDARVVAPSGAEDEAILQEVDKDRYAVRFIPHENGVHYIHVRLNGSHIPGSPFKVLVGQQDADPSRVRAYGEGLSRGITGHQCKFIVNTVNAGSGALAVTVDGPSKVQLNCREVEEGYEFTYTPTAPGDYLITIKYAGNTHIPGSPFKARIEGGAVQPGGWTEQSQVVVETVTKSSTTQSFAAVQKGKPASDASKVVTRGVGLKKAFINKETTFAVDCSQAVKGLRGESGINMLMVGVMGPHYPCEEIKIIHKGRNQYNVSYVVKERGDYVMFVKWGEDHVPGSPFHVQVQ